MHSLPTHEIEAPGCERTLARYEDAELTFIGAAPHGDKPQLRLRVRAQLMRAIALGPAEYLLLWLLWRKLGSPAFVAVKDLSGAFQHLADTIAEPSTIRSAKCRLRRKIDDLGFAGLLESRRAGYRLQERPSLRQPA